MTNPNGLKALVDFLKDDLENRSPPTSVPEKRRLMLIKGFASVSTTSQEAVSKLLGFGIVPVLHQLFLPSSSTKIKESALETLWALSDNATAVSEMKANSPLLQG